MKIKIQNYTFDVAQKKVTLTDYSNIRLDSLLLITNVTRNVIIYNFADETAGGSVSGNQVTVIADLIGMQDTDRLQIFYESDDIPVTDSTTQSLHDSIKLLKRIAVLLQPLSTQDGNNRQRVVVDSALGVTISTFSPAIANVTTVGTVSNIALMGNVDPRYLIMDQARVAYNSGIRANIKTT